MQPFIDFTGVFYFRHLLSFKNAAMEILFWYNVIIRLMIKEVQKMLKKRNILVMPGVLAVLAVLAGCEKQTVAPEPEEIPSVTLESAQIGTDEATVSMDIPADNEVLEKGDESGTVSAGDAEEIPVQEEEPEVPPVSEYTIVYTGDVCLQSGVTNTYRSSGVNGVIGEKLLQELTGADYTVINNEFCFSTGGAPEDKQYTFRADPADVSLLNEMGVDLVSLANNHALDYGTVALSDTFVTLDDAEIAYMGAGETVERAAEMITVDVNGYKIGYMAASRVYPTVEWNVLNRQPGMLPAYDPPYLAQVVEKKAKECDYLMIYLHWGIERAEHPESYERSLAQLLIDSGADAIIGSHPHVMQGVEYYQGRPIFYSLGNFVFNKTIGRTAFIRATIDMEAAEAAGADDLSDYVIWQMIPCSASGYCTEELSSPGDMEAFYNYMRSISYDVEYDSETGVLTDLNR